MKKQSLKLPIQWDINISILKNPLLWFQLFMVSFIPASYLMLLLVGLNLFEYHWDDIPASLGVGLIIEPTHKLNKTSKNNPLNNFIT